MTQDDLANRSGIPVITIRQWEYRRREPSLSTLLKLARGLGVSLAAFDGIDLPESATTSSPRTSGRSQKTPEDKPLPDSSDEAAADRHELTGELRERFIEGRREMRADLSACQVTREQAEQERQADNLASNPRTFGGKLRRLRESRGLSMGALGRLCGVSRQAIFQYETGGSKPHRATVERVALALGVRFEDLLDQAEPLKEKPTRPKRKGKRKK